MKGLWVVFASACLLLGALVVPGRADPPIGLRLDGRAGGDLFGASVAGAGDVDGDGVPDAVVGAPGADPAGKSSAGSAFVFSGANGVLLHRFDGQAAGDYFGFSVAAAGDVNGDGRADLLVGAPLANPGGRTDAGSAFLFSGWNGALLRRFDGPTPGDALGWSVAGISDLSGDGVPDVIAGAPYADPAGQANAGTTFLLSASDGAVLRRLDGEAAGDNAGFSVASAQDVDGDGKADVIVGAPGRDRAVGYTDVGAVYLVSGATGRTLMRVDGPLPGSTDYGLGYSVASAGDVNADGLPDVIAGAPSLAVCGHGAAFVLSGTNGAVLFRFEDPTAFSVGCVGRSVAGAGDVNGDGRPDLIVGAPSAYLVGAARGSALAFSGADGTLIRRFDAESAAEYNLGASVAGVGDVNGDGLADVIVGAPGADLAVGQDAGSVWALTPLGPSVVINPPPVPGGAYATNNALVRLLLPVVGAGTVELADAAGAWSAPASYAPRVDYLLSRFQGYRRVYARYRDYSGNIMADVSDGIYLDLSPPTIAIQAPVPGSVVAGVVAVTAAASDEDSGMASVVFKVDGLAVSTDRALPWEYDWNSWLWGDGTHELRAKALDRGGNSAEDVRTVTVDNSPPIITVESPAPASVLKGVVLVRAAARDILSGVARVLFMLDGTPVASDASAPYEWVWDTRALSVPEGPHLLSARAFDNAGNSSEAAVNVTVDNTTFDDVPKLHIFWRFVEGLVTSGVTSGCKSSPPLYCPGGNVTRGQMAKFLCLAAGKRWLDATVPTFADVPRTHTFYGYIERLADTASWGGNPPTSGCTATTYCPGQSVTRAQVAKFLCKARGKSWLAKAAPTFSDVPTNHLFYGWIERLADAGSWGGTAPTSGCGGGKYCPNDTVKRDQMAKFLVLAFGLPY